MDDVLAFAGDPHVVFSSDEAPLATTVQHLWSAFPHERNTGHFAYWLKPTTPLVPRDLVFEEKMRKKALIKKLDEELGLPPVEASRH